MSELIEILKESTVFASLDAEASGQLAGLFDKWEIHPGDTLTEAGDTAQTFFLLGKGTVLLSMDEGKAVVMDQPGDFIGLELLSAKGVYKTTVSVLEKGQVYAIPRQTFIDLIQEDSAAATSIMDAWQSFIDNAAPFAKNEEDAGLPIQF